MFFLGQYQHSLDQKGRLTIPAKFRDLLAEGAYITQGFDRNLRLITGSAFEALVEKISHLSMTDEATRQLRRLIFANASQVDLDRIGRVLIPQFLRDFAKLESEAVIVGVGEAIEIWSPDNWQLQLDELQNAELNAGRFAAFDLSL